MGAATARNSRPRRFNFTQPIIDSVTEDTNGTSANLAVEFSGPDSDVLLELARKTIDMLKGIRGATDVNIEQEGPQPQLVIKPDRALCARYNVRIEDVMKLVNMAIGGEPVSTLYEGERRFDIVARLDKTIAEIARRRSASCPCTPPTACPSRSPRWRPSRCSDGQTLIARGDGRRRMTVRCDIVGRDQGGFVKEAQERFDAEIDRSRRLSRPMAGHVREPRPRLQAFHDPDPDDHRHHLRRAGGVVRLVPGGVHPAVADPVRVRQRRAGPVPCAT